MLENLTVRDLIGERTKVFFVEANDTTDTAALKIRNFGVRTTGVMNDGEIVGVVGNSDFSTKVVAMSKSPSQVRVSDIMSTLIHKVTLNSTIFDCLDLMDKYTISHLFIMNDEGKYYGMLAWKDIQQRLVEELKYQLHIVHEYAFGPIIKENSS